MIIFRYFVKEILTSTFGASLVLMLIFASNRLAHYLNDAASGKLTLDAVMMVMSLQIPYLLGYLLPLALFLGVMLTLGRFYVDHEMVALSACGVSNMQIVRVVMVIASLITVLVGWLTLQLEPEIFRYRTQIVVRSVATMSLKKVIPGRFQKLRDEMSVLYVGKFSENQPKYKEIFMALREKPKPGMHEPYKWSILTAAEVSERPAPNNGMYFVFTQGNNYSGVAGEKAFDRIAFATQFVHQPPIPAVTFEGRYQLMDNTELLKLYPTDMHAVAELQWRISWTLSTLILALLAIPLSQVDPRLGRFAQLLPAILIYVVYLNMMFVGKSWVQDEKVSRGLGLWWVDAALLGVTLLIYLHKAGWQRVLGLRRVHKCKL